MRIINKTKYRTDDLKLWLYAAHKAMEAPHAQKTITITYSHKSMTWGCASYSGFRMMLTLPGDPSKIKHGDFAHLIEHEIGHNLGIKHGEMDQEMLYGTGREPSWEVPLPTPRLIEVKKITPQNRSDAKHLHSSKMVVLWEKKLKTATRQLRKWTAKLRYYEGKKIPALPTNP
jgi:hypothetical protein